jgi:hypothetical protein
VSTKDFNVYKTNLYLNISLTEPVDFGAYYCISKNEKGLTKAAIELFGNCKKCKKAVTYLVPTI